MKFIKVRIDNPKEGRDAYFNLHVKPEDIQYITDSHLYIKVKDEIKAFPFFRREDYVNIFERLKRAGVEMF